MKIIVHFIAFLMLGLTLAACGLLPTLNEAVFREDTAAAPVQMPTAFATPTLIPVNPSVRMTVDRTELPVGETVTLTVVPVDLGMAIYTLTLSSGANLRVTYYNELQVGMDDGVFAIESVEAELWEATIVLRALRPGIVEAQMHVSGEVHQGYPGPAFWGAGTAQLTLSVCEDC